MQQRDGRNVLDLAGPAIEQAAKRGGSAKLAAEKRVCAALRKALRDGAIGYPSIGIAPPRFPSYRFSFTRAEIEELVDLSTPLHHIIIATGSGPSHGMTWNIPAQQRRDMAEQWSARVESFFGVSIDTLGRARILEAFLRDSDSNVSARIEEDVAYVDHYFRS